MKTNNQIDSKMDWNLTDKDRISGRFSFGRPVMYQAPIFGDAGGPAQSAFEGTGTQKTYSTGINYNRIISPTLLTEVRIGVAHYHNEAFQTDYGKNDSTAIGIPGVKSAIHQRICRHCDRRLFAVRCSGYSASLPWDRAEANIDLVNSWTKILRNHQIKWGVDLRRIRDDLLQDQTYSPRGIDVLSARPDHPGDLHDRELLLDQVQGLANDMASFLLDQPIPGGARCEHLLPGLPPMADLFLHRGQLAGIAKLTVNLGLRWEIYTAPTPHFAGGFSNYDPANNTLVIAGVGQNPMNRRLQDPVTNTSRRGSGSRTG